MSIQRQDDCHHSPKWMTKPNISVTGMKMLGGISP